MGKKYQKRNQEKMLSKAIYIASQAHMKVLDRGKKAYIKHPIRVMMNLTSDDPELQQIAILHDVIEDCEDWTLDRLYKEGFSGRVLAALTLLTKTDEIDYETYIDGICTNYDAIRVKLADIKDNSDFTRLNNLGDKEIKMMKKYHKARKILLEAKDHFDLNKV